MTDQRILAGQAIDGAQPDQWPGDLIGQRALIEVGRQEQDQAQEDDTVYERAARVREAPAEEAERDGTYERHGRGPPVDRPD